MRLSGIFEQITHYSLRVAGHLEKTRAFRIPYMIGHGSTQTNTDSTTLDKEKMSVCVCVGLRLIFLATIPNSKFRLPRFS